MNPLRALGVAAVLGVVPSGSPAIQEKRDDRLTNANAKFALDLYARIVQDHAGKNVFVSPTGIAMALALLHNGGAGTTREALAKVLGLENVPIEEVNRLWAALAKDLKSLDPKVKLEIANSIWARESYPVEPAFVQALEKYFEAQVGVLTSDGRPINEWIREHTGGKIQQAVPEVTPESVAMYLINAVYFKAEWKIAFDKKETRDLPFRLLDGSTRAHPMMHQKGSFDHLQTDDLQAIRIPYGKDGRMSMVVFLPKEGLSLDGLHRRLTAENVARWMKEFRQAECDLTLPRFKLELEFELLGNLRSLGMPTRGYGGISKQDFGVGGVLHKTFVEVNEEGTEAAAVTVIKLTTSVSPNPSVFRADRPFVCMLRDDTTGSILFMGSIVDPR